MLFKKTLQSIVNLSRVLSNQFDKNISGNTGLNTSLKTGLKTGIIVSLGLIMNILPLYHQNSLAFSLTSELENKITDNFISQNLEDSTTNYFSDYAINESVEYSFNQEISLADFSTTKIKDFSPQENTYLYGQSPEKEQLGLEYLVFKTVNNKVVGAIYLPQSEFNCFYGNLTSQGLELSIVDPNDSAIYPYPIALETTAVVATTGNQVFSQDYPNLQGYYPIENLSQLDHQLLEICQESTI
jgi:hypothetical protein